MTLTYQNSSTYRSPFGALLTLASIAFVSVYFLTLLVDVLDRSKVIVTNSQDFRDLRLDKRIYPLKQEGFDVGIETVYLGTNLTVIAAKFETYVSVRIVQMNYKFFD